jgi:hypothetical protein
MAMNFDMAQTAGAVESKGSLTPGIHKATFKGIKKDTITTQRGDVINVMTLFFDIEGMVSLKIIFLSQRATNVKNLSGVLMLLNLIIL